MFIFLYLIKAPYPAVSLTLRQDMELPFLIFYYSARPVLLQVSLSAHGTENRIHS